MTVGVGDGVGVIVGVGDGLGLGDGDGLGLGEGLGLGVVVGVAGCVGPVGPAFLGSSIGATQKCGLKVDLIPASQAGLVSGLKSSMFDPNGRQAG